VKNTKLLPFNADHRSWKLYDGGQQSVAKQHCWLLRP